MGVTVSTGTFLSMIASCKSEPTINTTAWAPSFLTENAQMTFVENLADCIMPATDTPGAKEAGVIKYIDAAVANLYKPEEQERFKKGLETCIATIQEEQGAELADLSGEQLTAFLEKHIGTGVDEKIHEARRKLSGEKEPPIDAAQQKDYYLYGFLNSIKSLAIGGYFGSELIGEEHMNYDPIPGPYQGCIDFEGNNYSL